MGRERAWPFRIIVSTCLVVLLGLASVSNAQSLTRELTEAFDFGTTLGFDSTTPARAFAPSLSAAISQAVTQEFPLASVSPTFSYRYNPTLRLYEPSSTVSGPLFSERALTLGGQRLNLSVGYSYIDFQDLNGTSLNRLQSPSFLTSANPAGALPAALPGLGPDEQGVVAPIELFQLRTRLNLKAHVIVPSFRYGITDVWDISLAVPIVHISMKIRNDTRFEAETDPNQGGIGLALGPNSVRRLGFFNTSGTPVSGGAIEFLRTTRSPEAAQVQLTKRSGTRVGLGDISLRTKYQAWQTEQGGVALGLNLQVPTGKESNFHGTGELHVTPLLYASQVLWDRFEPHVNVGVDFNTDDVDRSSFVYAAGATLQVSRSLALLVDFIGRKEFGRLRLENINALESGGVTLANNRDPDTCSTADPCFVDVGRGAVPFFPGQVKTNYIADVAFGIRYVLGTSGSVFFGALLPLNDDGFRADFIPSGGIEYTF